MKLQNFYKKRDDTITIDKSVAYAVNKMCEQSLKYIVIIDQDKTPLGILTERDIMFFYSDDIDFVTSNAYKLSKKKLVKAHGQREIDYALNFMVDNQIRRVVIVDEDEKYLGVVEQEEIIFEFNKKSDGRNLKIFEILLNESKVISVVKETSLKVAIRIMRKYNFGSILVTNLEKPIGILTENDIVHLVNNKVDKENCISKYMHSPVHIVSVQSSINECIELMQVEKIRRIIVEEKTSTGDYSYYIITARDILNNLQGNYSKFLEAKSFSHRKTFDNLNDLIIEAYELDDLHVISWINNAVKDRLAVSVDDPLEKVIPPAILKKSLEYFDKDMLHVEENININNRQYRYTASCVKMFDSRIIKILLSDFTELYDSINEYQAIEYEIMNQDAIGIGYISLEGKIRFINKYMNDLLGYDDGELVGKDILALTAKEDVAASVCRMDLLSDIKSQKNPVIEKRYLHKDGTPIWISLKQYVVKDNNGNPKYIIGFIEDIRLRVEQEKRLGLAVSVFDNTSEGIMICDAKLVIQAVNNAFVKIYGFDKEDVIGKNAKLFKTLKQKDNFYNKIFLEVSKVGFWRGEVWGEKKNGEVFPLSIKINTIKDESNNIKNYILLLSDITAEKKSEDKLEFLAHHDALTKLPNRLLLKARLEQAINRAKRENTKVVLLFLDFDKFKEINDTYGHSYGDEVLICMSNRFKNILREEDTIARIGGDEFVFLIENSENLSDLESILEKVMNTFKEDIIVKGLTFQLSSSIGISIFPDDGKNIEDLIKNADTAMYQAKEAGKNTYRFYKEEMTQNLFERIMMKHEIDRGIQEKEFVLFYQPQICIRSGKVIGAEALVRWKHPNMGILSPDKFIKISEQTKQIIPLGKLIFESACKQIKDWCERDIICKRISVNISAVQIKYGDLFNMITTTLKDTGIDGSMLDLELTESYMMENHEEVIELIRKLKEYGITISIDDFGTGYSSLSYLKKLPIDKLKIDKSFVNDIPFDKDDEAITSTIIAMAKSLGLSSIAEGVETQEQFDFLKAEGCDEIQGYMYSKPLDVEDFEKYIKSMS